MRRRKCYEVEYFQGVKAWSIIPYVSSSNSGNKDNAKRSSNRTGCVPQERGSQMRLVYHPPPKQVVRSPTRTAKISSNRIVKPLKMEGDKLV